MKKKISLVLSLFMLFSINPLTVSANTSDYDNVQKIKTQDFFNQNEDDYYVYYYMEACPFCNQVKENMINFANKNGNVYFVDYKFPENCCKSYDWEIVIGKYNKVIGKINEVGNIDFLPNESMDKYIGLKNMYGKEMRFSFDTVTEENIYQFPGCEFGDVVANIQTPEIDYYNIVSVDQMVIAGVPVLFHVKNSRIVEFYFDSPEIETFLSDAKM